MGIIQKQINNILLFILVFFMVYDSARNYTHLPRIFGYLKDVIVYFWLLELIYLKKIKEPFSNIGFYIILLLAFLWSWIGILYPATEVAGNVGAVTYILKQNEFFILLFVFRNYEKIFSYKYDKYIKLYIAFSFFLFFVTLVGIYVDNNIVSKNIISENNEGFPGYENRIALGQPAVASFPQLISLVFLLLCKEKNITNAFISFICLLGIIMSTSMTGILVSFPLLLYIIGYLFWKGGYSTKIKLFFCMIGIIIVTSYFLQSDFFYENFSLAYLMVDTRIDQFFNGTSIDPSMEAREYQKSTVITILQNSIGGFIIGQGCNGASVENSFYGILLRFGIIGLIGYAIFLAYLLREAIKIKSMFMLLFIAIYIGFWYTLDALYVTTISYTFSFFLMYYMYYRCEADRK